MILRLRALIKRLKENIVRPEMLILPGQLAFFFLLTIAPLLALLINLVVKINLPTDVIQNVIVSNMPNGATEIFNTITKTANANVNVLIFFVSALVLASNGTHSMIVASNKIYNIKDKSYIERRGKAILMLMVLIILLLFMIVVPIFGDMIKVVIRTLIDSESIDKYFYPIYYIIRYPLSFILVFSAIKLLYIMAPDTKINTKQVNYGAIFTSFCWVIVTMLYSIYVQQFSNYDTLYGGLTTLLVLMWWIYLLAYIFVLGMALNVTKYQLEKK